VGEYVRRSLIEAAWGRGFVHIKLLGDLPARSGSLEQSRRSGRYLAKYVGKAMDGSDGAGLHRYEVAQGFQPRVQRIEGRTAEEVINAASKVMGRRPVVQWRSRDEESWAGPPAVWVAWDG
jgi:hypothetical protein